MTNQLKLAEIAARIDTHLKRMEADGEINFTNATGLATFYNACAYDAGRYVMVRYASYRMPTSLSKKRALLYMEWLDAGNNGTHYAFNAKQKND